MYQATVSTTDVNQTCTKSQSQLMMWTKHVPSQGLNYWCEPNMYQVTVSINDVNQTCTKSQSQLMMWTKHVSSRCLN